MTNKNLKQGILYLFLLLTFNTCSDVSNVNADKIEESEPTSSLNKPSQPNPEAPVNGADDINTVPTLVWSSVDSVDFYQLQLSNSEEFSTTVLDSTVDENRATVGELPNGATYHWRVRTSFNDTFSDWSEVFTFRTESIEFSAPSTDFWVTAYLRASNHDAGTRNSNWGKVTTDQIKWDAITHMIYFALAIDSDGSMKSNLDPSAKQNFNSDRLEAIVPAAHANDTYILFSVGGAGNGPEFSEAIRPENHQRFFSTIKNIITTYGFDGVDIDMEPIRSSDEQNYREFIKGLRAELEEITTNAGNRPLLTAAAIDLKPQLFTSLDDYFDQINMM